MKVDKFLKEVSDEIIRIKTVATSAEIAKLNIDKLQTGSTYGTVYGLLTGDFSSTRALEISPKTYDRLNSSLESGSLVTALEKYTYVNGKSSVECIDLFKFIKGEISTLTLKFDNTELLVNSFGVKKGLEIHPVKEFKF